MTELYNALKNIAADSTVKTVAVTLAVGGFLANAVFGLGKTTFSLAVQGISAATALGIVAASVYNKLPKNQTAYIPTQHEDKTSNDYFYQALPQQTIIEADKLYTSSIQKTFTPSISKIDKKSGDTYKDILNTAYGFGHQEKISPSWGPMSQMTQTFTAPESPKKRGNIYTQTLDIAYGPDNHADIYPWGRKRLY